MFDGRAAATNDGLTVELADLGGWGGATLIAEYDARLRCIRLNRRVFGGEPTAAQASAERQAAIDFAIAHELYHHREAIGAIERLPTHARREAAAEEFARSLVPAGGASFGVAGKSIDWS